MNSLIQIIGLFSLSSVTSFWSDGTGPLMMAVLCFLGAHCVLGTVLGVATQSGCLCKQPA